MTINEFIEKLNEMGVDGNSKLCVHAFGGICGIGHDIKDVSIGFDWDSGKTIIHTRLPLQLMPTKKPDKK
jgi:hypothetical protein